MSPQSDFFGIDLGTTNSCIATIKDGKLSIIDIDGAATTPSVLAYKDGEWVIGQKAKNHMQVEPSEAVSSIKRRMDDLSYMTKIGGESLTPIEVSAKILRRLVDGAKASCGKDIEKVVITVPAWFKEGQRQATLAAGKLAGLSVAQIVNEPTAAAIAHDASHVAPGQEEKWVVYDLGGGTFDVSVLNVTNTAHEVLASVGNTFLGGDDFDRRLAERFISKIKDEHNVDPLEDPVARARLFHIAERTKIELSRETEVELNEPFTIKGKSILLTEVITRDDFEMLIKDLLDSTLEKVNEALSEAKVSKDEVTRLLLVGGSTHMPCVAEYLKERFGWDGESWVDPDRSVALGAAIQSAVAAGSYYDREIVEISPHSLGIAALGHEDEQEPEAFDDNKPARTFSPLIRRNTRLPATVVKTFHKMHPEQERVEISVFQGESSHNDHNTFVGQFYAALQNRFDRRIDVRFTYNLDGTIIIGVEEPGQKSVRSYAMDLSKNADENSEAREDWALLDHDVKDIEKSTEAMEAETTNFLIEKVSQKLTQKADEAVAAKLAQYRTLLQAGEDDALDDLEQELYDWLEGEGE